MNKLFFTQIAVIFSLILASCGSSNQVVSNKLISKRKYTKGFFINSKDHRNNSGEETALNDKKNQVSENESLTNTVYKPCGVKTESEQTYNTIDAEILTDNTTLGDVISTEERGNTGNIITESAGAENKQKLLNKALHKTHKTNKQKITSKAASDSSFMQILLIVILVVLIIAIFSFLDGVLGGTLSLILGIVVLAFLIWLILRLLGVI